MDYFYHVRNDLVAYVFDSKNRRPKIRSLTRYFRGSRSLRFRIEERSKRAYQKFEFSTDRNVVSRRTCRKSHFFSRTIVLGTLPRYDEFAAHCPDQCSRSETSNSVSDALNAGRSRRSFVSQSLRDFDRRATSKVNHLSRQTWGLRESFQHI